MKRASFLFFLCDLCGLCGDKLAPNYVVTVSILVLMLTAGALGADTNSGSADDIPPLRPPRGEMAPTFREQYGRQVAAGTVLGLTAVGAAVWLLMRPKRAVDVPIEVETRTALEALRSQPEDGAVLSRVSQILRHYATRAFGLPPDEMTTTEFCRLIAGEERIGSELAAALADFLRRCDERKFSPPGPGPAQGAVAQALEMVARGEARRAELRSAETVGARHGGVEQ